MSIIWFAFFAHIYLISFINIFHSIDFLFAFTANFKRFWNQLRCIFRRFKVHFNFLLFKSMSMCFIFNKARLAKSKIFTLFTIKSEFSWFYRFKTSITWPPNVFIIFNLIFQVRFFDFWDFKIWIDLLR